MRNSQSLDSCNQNSAYSIHKSCKRTRVYTHTCMYIYMYLVKVQTYTHISYRECLHGGVGGVVGSLGNALHDMIKLLHFLQVLSHEPSGGSDNKVMWLTAMCIQYANAHVHIHVLSYWSFNNVNNFLHDNVTEVSLPLPVSCRDDSLPQTYMHIQSTVAVQVQHSWHYSNNVRHSKSSRKP